MGVEIFVLSGYHGDMKILMNNSIISSSSSSLSELKEFQFWLNLHRLFYLQPNAN
jgi:hypothetical protein